MKRIVALVAILAVAVSGTALAAGGKAKKTSGTVWAGVTHQEGSTLFVGGDIKDKVLGRGAIVYQTTVSANSSGEILIKAKKITIYTDTGTLTGTGSGTQVNGDDANSTPTVVKDGEFNLTKGTGSLKGHSLKGTFDGPYKDGIYTFSYKGTLK
jgi:hypothetical protein